MLLRLAFRNLRRNGRRSIVTLLSISFGFAAIAVFAGYDHNVYDSLQRKAIHSELLGHLTIQKKGMDREGRLDPERYLLRGTDVARITALLHRYSGVRLVAPRLSLTGIISNGRASTIFLAEGIEPDAMRALEANMLSPEEARSGLFTAFIKKLDGRRPDSVALSKGLSELLGLPVGARAAVVVNTVNGQVNASDVSVGDAFTTGNAGTNDKMVYMPLALARSLYDVGGGADRLTVLLDDGSRTEAMRVPLAHALSAATGLDLEVRSWRDLSAFYTQVHGMFDMIFGFILVIVLTIVITGIGISMGMTVVERTREIGTLRAIGLQRSGVVLLFSCESMLLAILGCAIGLVLALGIRVAVNAAGISYDPPNGASPVPLLVDIDGPRMLVTFCLMTFVGTAAGYLPARRAARQAIIDELGHV